MGLRDKKETVNYWVGVARKALVGFTITDVKYIDDDDWDANPVIIYLKKPVMGGKPEELVMIPQSDDEGNNGGALFIHNGTTGKDETLPVIWNM
jgi:hypothetical protein